MTDKGARGRAAAVAAAADVSEQGNRNRPPMTTIVRSEQVEADLDRKIRQIRERNLLILNRQKIIEADKFEAAKLDPISKPSSSFVEKGRPQNSNNNYEDNRKTRWQTNSRDGLFVDVDRGVYGRRNRQSDRNNIDRNDSSRDDHSEFWLHDNRQDTNATPLATSDNRRKILVHNDDEIVITVPSINQNSKKLIKHNVHRRQNNADSIAKINQKMARSQLASRQRDVGSITMDDNKEVKSNDEDWEDLDEEEKEVDEDDDIDDDEKTRQADNHHHHQAITHHPSNWSSGVRMIDRMKESCRHSGAHHAININRSLGGDDGATAIDDDMNRLSVQQNKKKSNDDTMAKLHPDYTVYPD